MIKPTELTPAEARMLAALRKLDERDKQIILGYGETRAEKSSRTSRPQLRLVKEARDDD